MTQEEALKSIIAQHGKCYGILCDDCPLYPENAITEENCSNYAGPLFDWRKRKAFLAENILSLMEEQKEKKN